VIDIRRFPLDTQQVRNAGLRALLILLTLVSVAVLYDRPLVLSGLAVGIGVVVAMTVDRRLVIPIIVLLLPLEIGARLIPILQTDQTARLGASALNLARLGILAGAMLWTIRARSDWWRELPRSSLYLPLVLLLGLYLLSLSNTEDIKGAVDEVARLTLHMVFLLLILLHVRDRQSLRWVILALIISGLVVALIGIFEQITDTYLWNEESLRRLGVRRNATFVNSNYFARFLVITMVMATALFFHQKSRLRYLLAAAFAFAALALPFTSSRSNWVAAATVLPLLVLVLPIKPRLRVRLLAIGAVSGIALIGIVAAREPALADRLQTLTSARENLAARSFQVRAGWQMFLDHPLFGVGLASYDDELLGPYIHFAPPGFARASDGAVIQSHTSVITVMSELGIAGLMVLGLLLYRFARGSWRLYREASAEDRALVAGLFGAFLVILLHSNFGAHFFTDPYLWLVVGLMMALAAIRQREARSDTPREASVER